MVNHPIKEISSKWQYLYMAIKSTFNEKIRNQNIHFIFIGSLLIMFSFSFSLQTCSIHFNGHSFVWFLINSSNTYKLRFLNYYYYVVLTEINEIKMLICNEWTWTIERYIDWNAHLKIIIKNNAYVH